MHPYPLATHMHVCRLIAALITLAAFISCSHVSYGQTNAEENSDRIRKLDALIVALANRNEEPKIVKIEDSHYAHVPLFSDSYDWNEQHRVIEVLRALASQDQDGDELWPRLFQRFDDKKYSLTYSEDIHARNASVGDFCYWLALEHLESAYHSCLPPNVEHLHPIIFSPDKLEKWYGDRKDKLLHELQVEMAELAIVRLKKPEYDWVTEKQKSDFAAKVSERIEVIKREKKATIKGIVFRGEWADFFTEKDATKFKEEYLSQQKGTSKEADTCH